MKNSILSPTELAQYTIDVGQAKVAKSNKTVLISSIFSGAFIAFAALASLGATYGLYANGNTANLDTYGLAKFFQGIVFAAGLMFIIFLGTDLFTGNSLISMAVLDKKTTVQKMIKNWTIVFFGNLIGALIIGLLVYKSGVFGWSDSLYGDILHKTIESKSNLAFSTAFFSGILCNVLVCSIVLATYAVKDTTTKQLIILSGILLFVAGGYEHVVANMGYYAGALLMGDFPNIGDVLVNNIIPVTLGNVVGGALFIGAAYYYMVKDKL